MAKKASGPFNPRPARPQLKLGARSGEPPLEANLANGCGSGEHVWQMPRVGQFLAPALLPASATKAGLI